MSAVLDASAPIAFLRDEPGAEVVQNLLGPAAAHAHALNLCEVYYDFWKASTKTAAESAIADLFALGIKERNDMDSEFWRKAGEFKAIYRKVSLADCCGLAWLTGSALRSFPRIGTSLSRIELIR